MVRIARRVPADRDMDLAASAPEMLTGAWRVLLGACPVLAARSGVDVTGDAHVTSAPANRSSPG